MIGGDWHNEDVRGGIMGRILEISGGKGRR
jgi:hypothetical protein